MVKDRIWTLVSRKLSGEATASELTELNDLIMTESNADLYVQAIAEYWSIPSETDEEFIEATYHLHLNRLKQKGFDLELEKEREDLQPLYDEQDTTVRRRRNNIKLGMMAAVCSVLIFFSFLLFKFQNKVAPTSSENNLQSEIITKAGSRTRIQLPDGSSVWLNGGSKLVYDNVNFGKNFREVTLIGEGYFDVVENKEKPFIIHANKVNIKVLGTAFNVKAYPDEKNTETSLVRGSIEVTMKNRTEIIMMKPNDKLIVSNDETEESGLNNKTKKKALIRSDVIIEMRHLTIANDESTIIETAWVDNKLVFDKASFEEVAQKMEKWYGVSILITDDQLKLQQLTGTFERETVAEALRALKISTPIFKYEIINQQIKIFK